MQELQIESMGVNFIIWIAEINIFYDFILDNFIISLHVLSHVYL